MTLAVYSEWMDPGEWAQPDTVMVIVWSVCLSLECLYVYGVFVCLWSVCVSMKSIEGKG